MTNPTNIRLIAILLALTLLAGALRFYSLGTWPFSGDETATLDEESVLFHAQHAAHDSELYRLPHLIPASYLVFHISHTLFGLDEWGTRVVIALLGTLSVALVFVLLDGPMPRVVAIATALLLALMPQHVMHSQETRFYIVAAFFAYACLLVGARILCSRSTLFAILACCLAFLAVLAHTLLVMLLPLVFLGVCAGAYADKRSIPVQVWYVFALGAVAMSAFFALYAWPLVHGWNKGQTWGYSAVHALLASIAMIGWPITLLAVIGFVLMLRERTAQNWYWLVCFLGWISATLAFPLVVTYHAEYVFPLALSGMVLAGYAIGVTYELLRTRSPLAARAWIGLICLANLPSLASHYVDGSRRDERSATAYVRDHWQPGDRVTGYSMGLFRHYSHGCCEPAIPLNTNSVPQLERLGAESGRLWVVLESSRSGLDPTTQRWLFDCAAHKLTVGKRRFDEDEFKVEVYLASTPLSTRCMGEESAHR